MDARESLIEAALALLEQSGEAGFTTRAVCERAGVTAPTLYHHFKDANGLLSAAVLRGFDQYLARKQSKNSPNVRQALLDGWDDYVAFARERPRLYAAMIARVLQGATIPASAAARALLVGILERLQAQDALAVPVDAAASLYLNPPATPDPAAVADLRAAAAGVLRPRPEGPDHD